MQKIQRGFMALSMVLIISAVIIGIATTVTILAVEEAESGLTLTNGETTLAFVEGCTEDALNKAQSNGAYNGGNITRPEGTCTVTVNSKVGNTWTITISTTTTTYSRSIQIVFTKDSYGDTITTWKEL